MSKPHAKKQPVKRFTHADRAKRRQRMATEVKRGSSLSTVARRHKVTLHTVRGACVEYGVDWRRENPKK